MKDFQDQIYVSSRYLGVLLEKRVQELEVSFFSRETEA